MRRTRNPQREKAFADEMSNTDWSELDGIESAGSCPEPDRETLPPGQGTKEIQRVALDHSSYPEALEKKNQNVQKRRKERKMVGY